MRQRLAFIVASFMTLGILSGCCTFSTPGYRGLKSDHFDGKRFYNEDAGAYRTFFDFLKWVTNRRLPQWHPFNMETPPLTLEPRVGKGELVVTFINHSTFLVQMDGVNILTDPMWSERPSPVSFSGPARVHPPGVLLEDLPAIDIVVVSHNHYDHLDLPTLKRISERDKPRIFVGLGNQVVLNKAGIEQVTEMDWWQEEPVSDSLYVVCVPSQHFSGRGMCDFNKTLWAGFVFESTSGVVYFAGDTGFGSHFQQIAQCFNHIRLALLPIGAFRPEWFMSATHMSPKDALKAHFVLGAQNSVAMHFGTFLLGDDEQGEAESTLASAIAQTDMQKTNFWIIHVGESKSIPPLVEAQNLYQH